MKKKTRSFLISKIFMVFAVVFVMALTMGTKSEAATAAPTGLRQSGAGESSVKIAWNPVFGEDINYYWRISDTSRFTTYNSDRASSSCNDSIYGLQAGKTYYVQIGTSVTSKWDSAPADTTWSPAVKVVTTPVEVDYKTIKFTSATETSISLSWGSVAGATSYKVKYWKSETSSDTGKWALTSRNSIKISRLSKNSEYSFSVYPIRKDGSYAAMQGYGAAKSWIPTLPTKVYGVDCTSFNMSTKKGEASFEWDRKDTANGYQYEIYKYNSKKRLVSGYTTNSYARYINVKSSKLKPRQFYRIRVRAYVNTSDNKKKYGAWSSYDYFSRCVGDDISLRKSGKSLKASWKKVSGAKDYTVYVANKYTGKYKKLTTTKKTYCTITKSLKKGKYYYVRIVPNMKVGRTTYKAVLNSKRVYSGYAWYSKYGRLYTYDY